LLLLPQAENKSSDFSQSSQSSVSLQSVASYLNMLLPQGNQKTLAMY